MFKYISVFVVANKIDKKNWKTWDRREHLIGKSSFISNFYQQGGVIIEPF